MSKSNLIIYYVIILQFVTALFLFFSPEPIRVASLGVFYNIFAIPQIGAFLMVLAIILSIIGLNIREDHKLRVVFFIPQYVFLLLTSGSALNSIIEGRYADGVVRPSTFIFIDQLPSLITVILYTPSIFNFRKEKDVTKQIGEVV